MGVWGENSFSNDAVYDFLQLDVIPFRIIGGVDDLEITKDILEEIISDIDNCDDSYIRMAAIIFLVYKGCFIDMSYIDFALCQAQAEYNNIKKGISGNWNNPKKRLIKLDEEIGNLERVKIKGKIDALHISSITDSVKEKIKE